jgi:hypothetical protein
MIHTRVLHIGALRWPYPHSVIALEIFGCALQGGPACLDDGAMVGLWWIFSFFSFFFFCWTLILFFEPILTFNLIFILLIVNYFILFWIFFFQLHSLNLIQFSFFKIWPSLFWSFLFSQFFFNFFISIIWVYFSFQFSP